MAIPSCHSSEVRVAITVTPPTPPPGDRQLCLASAYDIGWKCPAFTEAAVLGKAPPWQIGNRAGECRFVHRRSLHPTGLENFADEHFKDALWTRDYVVSAGTRTDSEHGYGLDLKESLIIDNDPRPSSQHPSLIETKVAQVETWIDQDYLVTCSDKQFQIISDQTTEKQQRHEPILQIIKLRTSSSVLRIIETKPEVIVLPRKALHIRQLIPTRLLKTITAIQINAMEGDIPISIFERKRKDTAVTIDSEFAISEIIAGYATDSDVTDNDVQWSLIHNRDIDLSDTIESPISILSPLSPLSCASEISPSFPITKRQRRAPSIISETSIDDRPLPVTHPFPTVLVNGKPHAHPLRSNPVTEADFGFLPPHLKTQMPPRSDSLLSSESSKGSISGMISPTTTRPLFPPRKDSLVPPSVRSSGRTVRPSTSHPSIRFSQALDFSSFMNKSQSTLATPAQKQKAIHRRSASVADILNSFTRSGNRAQPSPTPHISAPILIQAPPKPPATVPVPAQVQRSTHMPTPYTMKPLRRSQTWNTSQVSIPSVTSTPILHQHHTTSNTPNDSQVSLLSTNPNRKAFVMQRPNTSIFSLHSQNSTQDLNGMLSGYDTHPTNNINGANGHSRKDAISAPQSPLSLDTTDDSHPGRTGSEDIRPSIPIDLKERRFRRILNLRRANAAFASAGASATKKSNSSATVLPPVSEVLDSRRGSVYTSLAPSQMQIDVAAATAVHKRSVAFQGAMVGSRRR